MTLDGRTALRTVRQRITGEDAGTCNVRARSSVIVTGVGTVLADDPRLDVPDRARTKRGAPTRSGVLDSLRRTPARRRILGHPVVLLCSAAADATGATDARPCHNCRLPVPGVDLTACCPSSLGAGVNRSLGGCRDRATRVLIPKPGR